MFFFHTKRGFYNEFFYRTLRCSFLAVCNTLRLCCFNKEVLDSYLPWIYKYFLGSHNTKRGFYNEFFYWALCCSFLAICNTLWLCSPNKKILGSCLSRIYKYFLGSLDILGFLILNSQYQLFPFFLSYPIRGRFHSQRVIFFKDCSFSFILQLHHFLNTYHQNKKLQIAQV